MGSFVTAESARRLQDGGGAVEVNEEHGGARLHAAHPGPPMFVGPLVPKLGSGNSQTPFETRADTYEDPSTR